MNSLKKRKIAKQYRNAISDIAIYGDSLASTITNALDLGVKGAGEIVSTEQAAKNLKQAQSDASQAQSDALIAQAAAVSESDPNGPKHQAAAAAASKAQMAAQRVLALQMAAGASSGVPASKPPEKAKEKPWYFWPMVVGGLAVGGAVVYRVVASRGGSGSRRYPIRGMR